MLSRRGMRPLPLVYRPNLIVREIDYFTFLLPVLPPPTHTDPPPPRRSVPSRPAPRTTRISPSFFRSFNAEFANAACRMHGIRYEAHSRRPSDLGGNFYGNRDKKERAQCWDDGLNVSFI
jgi:hypothetical protein